jgi:hypothetical protein
MMMRIDPATVRYILDDQNHDDYALPGDAMPEAPIDGLTYGRGGRGWYPVLPLNGGRMLGALELPEGTITAPSLAFGALDGTGMGRSGTALAIGVQGALLLAVFTTGAQFYQPLSMLNNRITTLGDATTATDALNLRTADARYAPGPWTDFPADPGYTLVTLRYRTVADGLQLSGEVGAPLPAQARARMGVLPAGVRPARMQRFPATVAVGINVGMAAAEVLPDGSVWHQWTIGDAPNVGVLSMNAIIPLD